jgi:Uma2 family endonuclease
MIQRRLAQPAGGATDSMQSARFENGMAQPAPARRVTDAEYFQLEQASQDKHQLWLGEIFAMAGGSPAHNLISMNVGSTLRNSLRTGRCAVLSADQRIKAPLERTYLYADVTVACEPLQLGLHETLLNPTLLVEVLSGSTEAFDRGDKFDAYSRMPSVRHVLLVSSHHRHVDAFSRQPDGLWLRRTASASETLVLTNPDLALPLDEVYLGADAIISPAV